MDKNESGLAKFLSSKNGLTSSENIMQDKCVPAKDAHIRRTCVVSTEISRLWSKKAVLAAKMLKIRKKSQTKAFS